MSSSSNSGKNAFLVIQRGGDIGSLVFLDKPQITIGRNADNVIPLNDTMVSRYHAVIQQNSASGEVTVIDLGSTNGVYVNDQQIDPGLPHPLQQRDTIYIGHSVFNLQMRPENFQSNPPPLRENDPERTQHLDMRQLFS